MIKTEINCLIETNNKKVLDICTYDAALCSQKIFD